jgi:predicted membrane channel-forming protein YqfA (hemolysin III family)
MSIGTGIFLFVVGAILTFALEVKLDWIDLDLVGYILMAAGVVIFLIGIIMLATRRSRARSTTVVEDDRI